ncbi:AAEL010180-PA [Aedes aegypti]|uniref:AAEL010180-PA n=2 Tax=Aedes aegypti TaxID=7159 RepID=A0A1S4FPH8_AEDAE|nr:uncharacterized protein LOC5572962 [Aedes aegypti]EAT37891.1 AAEL010180-PA [Aedes aegypti]
MAGSENQEVPANEEEISGQEDAEEEESSEEEAPPAPQPAPKSKEKAKSKFVLLHEFIRETDNFLARFDDLVENRDQQKTLYMARTNPLRETLVTLLLRFIQNELPRDDYLYKHIKCCDEEPLNNEEFAEHYEEAHKKDDEGKTSPELDAITAYNEVCKFYIAEGKVVNVDLLFKLRRLLRKTNTVMGGVLLDTTEAIAAQMKKE